MSPTPSEKPHYHGHRQRLRARFLQSGAEALAEYELLELLLCLAIPRGDVKPLAKALMARFGSFAGVVTAEPARLRELKGVGDTVIAALQLIPAASARLAREQLDDKPLLGNWEALIDYLQIRLGHLPHEEFHILFLNSKNRLIADEAQAKGTVNATPVYPREVVKRALELHATTVVLVHNHPSGDPRPSRADIQQTKQIASALKAVDITLLDHIIIARGGYNSLKALGVM